MSKRRPPTSASARRRNTNIAVVIVVLIAATMICGGVFLGGGMWFFNRVVDTDPTADVTPVWAPDSAELTIAVSPVMAPVFAELVAEFNAQNQQTPDGQTMRVAATVAEPERMVAAALDNPPFQALSPDSSLWLDRLEQSWLAQSGGQTESQIPIGQRRVSEQTRYAVSPIVIAAWESVARELGWPDRPIGWEDIQQQATRDENFKWNHPSTNSAAGLLATLAEFYAGAGLTRGLTEEAATDQATLDYVRAVEATVRFYGEGEEVIVDRLAEEGRNFLDAFVAQERVVIDWNQNRRGDPLVAIYPAEGTLWTDHPLALLELGGREGEFPVTDNQRLTYRALAAFLSSPAAQQKLLAAGYRPADLSIALDAAGSPFSGTAAVDWREPQTTLQMPSPAVVDVVQNFWYYTKRPTNVYLVVDTSGSMEGTKIDRTREALAAFVEQIRGDRDRVGIVEFASGTKDLVPLTAMDEGNRLALLTRIDNMQAEGGTALLDATYDAIELLLNEDDSEAINAIVVMTDGQENESFRSLAEIQRLLRSASTPPVVFTIGFGEDADENVLSALAQLGGGQFRRADETDIAELYRIISTYF